MSFDISYLSVMCHEGLYSFDASDFGGETWKGISRKMHPDWVGWQIVDSAKESTHKFDLANTLNSIPELEISVQLFYQKNYWEKMRLNEIHEQYIEDELFDTAINQGLKTATKYLQRALNLLNNNGIHYSNLKVDGDLGAKTIKAYNAYMLTAIFKSRSKSRNVNTLLKAINLFQAQRYVEICERNESQEIYFYGWLNRV